MDDELHHPPQRRIDLGAFRAGDGTTVVYSLDNPQAWIRADNAVEVEA